MTAGTRSGPDSAGRMVVADVFRLERALVLDRAPRPPDGLPARVLPPAVLVIPRGGGLRDPYLVVLDRRGDAVQHLSKRLDFVDFHVVARTDRGHDQGWSDVADVLAYAGQGARRDAVRTLSTLLDRYPGSEIAICGTESGHLAELRDGRLVRITAVAAGRAADPVAPFGGYGSVLHAWLAAGLPLECLEQALVVAGRYVAPWGARPGRLLVAARDHIHCESSPYGRSRRAA